MRDLDCLTTVAEGGYPQSMDLHKRRLRAYQSIQSDREGHANRPHPAPAESAGEDGADGAIGSEASAEETIVEEAAGNKSAGSEAIGDTALRDSLDDHCGTAEKAKPGAKSTRAGKDRAAAASKQQLQRLHGLLKQTDNGAPRTAGMRKIGAEGTPGGAAARSATTGSEQHCKDPAARRVAKMLLVLGEEQAAEILRHLPAEEVERVAAELARVTSVGVGEARELAGELGALMKRTRLEPQGGPATAMRFLKTAFGAERGQSIFTRAVGRPVRAYFDFLEELEPTQLITLFKNEAPPVVSIVMAWLSPGTASKVLQGMAAETQRDVVKRLSRMRKVDATVLQQTEAAIKEKIRRQGRVVSQEIDGQSAVAAILRHMDSASGDEIIARMRREEPELAEAVEQHLFTIESVLYIEDADLQGVLRELSDTVIALVLKGKREAIRSKVLHNVSMRRRRMVAEECHRLGAVPRREVDAAVDEFVGRLRVLETEGKLRFIDQQDLVD